jgi:hypothetical protein
LKQYEDYQKKLDDVEKQEDQSSDAAEMNIPAFYLIIGAVISGAATYYLNEAGMRGSPLFERTIGAQNGALLVLAILEGSFLALTLAGHRILKSKPQRSVGKFAIYGLEGVLSVNIIVASLLLSGAATAALTPLIRLYATFGAPLTVIGALWLWTYLVIHRRKTMMRDRMLDDAAEVERLWAEQHRLDQERYRETYQRASASPEAQAIREEIAGRAVLDQLARQGRLSEAERDERLTHRRP